MNKATQRDYIYYKQLAQSHAMPSAYLDLDVMHENLQALLDRSGDKYVRIASKSIRNIEVLREIFKFSKRFRGLMAYSLEEALFLIEQGFDDVLLGYPDLQEGHLKTALKVAKAGKKITFMVDDSRHITLLNALALKEGVKARVCVDVDMSVAFPGLWFGVYRSKLRKTNQFFEFALKLKNCKGIELVGIMGYEAQIAGVMDNERGNWAKNLLVRLLKRISLPMIAKRRAEAVRIFEQVLDTRLEFVNAGGTGSLESSILEDWVTEVTVGSGVYASHLFDNYVNFKHNPALFYGIQVLRNPQEGIYVAHGGGYTASGSVDTSKAVKPYLPEGMTLFANEGAGEVQTPFRYKGKDVALGDVVFFRHAKAGELLERFNELQIISGGKLEGVFPSYRGMGKCFL